MLWSVLGDELVAHTGMGSVLKADPEAAIAEAFPVVEDDLQRPRRTAILLLDPLSGNGEMAAMLGPSCAKAGSEAAPMNAATDELAVDLLVDLLSEPLAQKKAQTVVHESLEKLGWFGRRSLARAD